MHAGCVLLLLHVHLPLIFFNLFFALFSAGCGRHSQIRQLDTLACSHCGHRILYKPRTARSTLSVCVCVCVCVCLSVCVCVAGRSFTALNSLNPCSCSGPLQMKQKPVGLLSETLPPRTNTHTHCSLSLSFWNCMAVALSARALLAQPPSFTTTTTCTF